MSKYLRVAYFPDSFLEVDGVAMTSNKLVKFARERELPFLCIHAGPKNEIRDDGSIRFVTLKRSPLSIPLDHSLRYDPFFQRHIEKVRRAMVDFKPDVVHITGPNDVSIMGAWMAWKLDIALVGSWHTNIHEYAARRLRKSLWFMPQKMRWEFTKFIERQIRTGAKLYYTMPQVLLAPNQELVEMLQTGTPRPSKLMIRGVDTNVFSPEKRTVVGMPVRAGRAQERQCQPRADADKHHRGDGHHRAADPALGDQAGGFAFCVMGPPRHEFALARAAGLAGNRERKIRE